MKLPFVKMSGAGNDFIMIDNRENAYKLDETQIHQLCTRRKSIGADGLIIISPSETYQFKMLYYNSDGRLGSMCGNGGRCAVRFASNIGAITDPKAVTFEANDNLYKATVDDETNITLKMQPPVDFQDSLTVKNYTCSFVNTGSPHAILFQEDIKHTDVVGIGKSIRHSYDHFKSGTNVNFVEVVSKNLLKLRTFERGVEDETLACGTGAVAAAIMSYKLGFVSEKDIKLIVHSQDQLRVSFDENFQNVYLSGPAVEVFTGTVEL